MAAHLQLAKEAMVNEEARLDTVFAALSDPVRRAIEETES